MNTSDQLRATILEKLRTVIDPETGVDVVRMRLIEDLTVSDTGHIAYKFRPSSALCPLAVPLADAIQRAVAEVEGVTGQTPEIVGYLQAEALWRCSNCRPPIWYKQKGKTNMTVEQNIIRRIIAVVSGKGGVGTSLVSGLLAVTLRRAGHTVGLLDADALTPSSKAQQQ